MKKPPITSLWMGHTLIHLESTALEDIIKTIKSGKIEEQGDAANYVQWICYTTHDIVGPINIKLSAFEIDGGIASDIHAFRIGAADKACPELPTNFTPIRLNNNLWIMTRSSDVFRVFGKPTRRDGDWMHYETDRKIKIRGEDWVEHGMLSLRFWKGRVIELRAYKTTQD
jgi:hypothetical protein